VFQMWLGLPYPSIVGIPRCMCTHPIDIIGVHFLCCAHGNECTSTHDAICDIFVTIAQDPDFHVGWKQLHTFPSTTFHSCQHYVHQRWNLHLNWHYHCILNTSGFISLIMNNSKICYLRRGSNQTKEICNQ
jgi:hypothetical protein